MSGSGDLKLVEECGTNLEQVRPYLGRCIGIISFITSDHAPKGQKTVCGHLRVWWLQSGGTGSVEQGGNKSGHTKFDVIEPFSGSRMPIGEYIGPQNGPKRPKGVILGP